MSQHPGSILHLIDTTGPGGAETVFTQLAAHTQDQGYRTLAVIRGPGWVNNELERLGVETQLIDCKGSFNLRFLWQLIRIIRREKISLIQAHLLGSSVYASLAGFLTRTPVISTFHGHVDVSPKERLRALKFLLIKLGSRKVIAVTRKLADMLDDTTSLGPEKIAVIPNGIDTTTFSNAAPLNLREDYNIPESATIIGCLGNVRTAKNYALAIDTLKALNSRDIDCYLFIAGDDTNTLASELKGYAADQGLESRVVWLGFLQDNAGFLKAIDTLLLSSSSEGHPLAITQAMAAETPIISTPCGVEEIVTDGLTAYISSSHSAGALADRVIELLSDDASRQEIVTKANSLAASTFSLEAMIDRYDQLYLRHKKLKKKHNWAAQLIVDRYGSKRALLTTTTLAIKDVFSPAFKDFKNIPKDVDRVVFVCKGNICRSAAAATAFSQHSNTKVASLGLRTDSGKPADGRITTIMASNNYDMSSHKTTNFSDFTPLRGDFYLCMEPEHAETLREFIPNARIALLGAITSPKRLYIHDPYSSSERYARRCTEEIVKRSQSLAKKVSTTETQEGLRRAAG